MASYRSVYTTFWTDTKVSDDFTPEDKYFMLYCLTNNYTNLCGCYEISIKQMAIDTGYNEETIKKLLKRFNSIHKIIFYNEGNTELLIKNWYKYDWNKSNKLDKPLLNEIQKIKTIEFKKIVADEYNKRDTVSIPYTYPMDTSVLYCTASDTVTESVSDIENKQNAEIIKCYEENIGLITPATAEILFSYNDIDYKMIIEAIKIASINNKRTCRYIQGILNSWINKGYKIVTDIQNEQEQYKEEKKIEEHKETKEERIARLKREWGEEDED